MTEQLITTKEPTSEWHSIFYLADQDKRDYVTPEDIQAAINSNCAKELLQSDVLKLLGRQTNYGWEDAGLCAFIAYRYERDEK